MAIPENLIVNLTFNPPEIVILGNVRVCCAPAGYILVRMMKQIKGLDPGA